MTTNPPPESVPRRKRLESLIDRFLNFLFIASASVIVLLAAWLIITMPGGSGDPRAPVAGPVPTLAWLYSFSNPSSSYGAAPLKCGPVFLYVPRSQDGTAPLRVTVSSTPPDDRTAERIPQLWAFDRALVENGYYRSLYEQRSLARASLRPLTFAESPASHVEGHSCSPYKAATLKCAPDAPFC